MRKSYPLAFTSVRICKGFFKVSDIVPLNENIFTGKEVLRSFVTDKEPTELSPVENRPTDTRVSTNSETEKNLSALATVEQTVPSSLAMNWILQLVNLLFLPT